MAVFRGVLSSCVTLIFVTSLAAQVKPAQILNPRLKMDEAQYLPQLESLQHSIQAQHFIFPFRLSGYANVKRGHDSNIDASGIEFVYFNDLELIKVAGVYEAAYSASSLTENERAAKTLQQVIVPIMQLVIQDFPEKAPGDGIGIEIIYNTRDHETAYDFEGREVITAVFSWKDARAYCQTNNAVERQDILNQSDIYLNGKAFGLALSQRNPLPVEALERSVPARLRYAQSQVGETSTTISPRPPLPVSSPPAAATATGKESMVAATIMNAESEQSQFKKQLDALLAGDKGKINLDADAPPSFEEYGDQVALHITLLNPLSYAQNTVSIYRMAAQGLDLVIAPELKSLLTQIPSGAYFSLFHFTVIENDGPGKAKAETIDYLLPLDSVRSLVANKITSQDLADQSTILVNSVRIHVNLQLVE